MEDWVDCCDTSQFRWGRVLSTYVFPYTAPKQIKVKIWQVGAFHRCLQLGVLIYMIVEHYTGDSWTLAETPSASVNAWHSTNGNAYYSAVNVSDYAAEYTYCRNVSSNLYKQDDYYTYDAPRCLYHAEDEMVQKALGSVHFTTAYIEKTEIGWRATRLKRPPTPHARGVHTFCVHRPCGDANSTAKAAQCAPVGVTRLQV